MSARSRRRPLSSRKRTIACPPTTRPTASIARPLEVARFSAKLSASLRSASMARSSRSDGSGASQVPNASARCGGPSVSNDVSPATCGRSSAAPQDTTTCGSLSSSALLRSFSACRAWISDRRRTSFSAARVRVRINRMAETTEKPRMASTSAIAANSCRSMPPSETSRRSRSKLSCAAAGLGLSARNRMDSAGL